ncbi:MAG: hypothetical protein JKY50_04950 [Oleispira sp.]|nr:hypothetical protein [Oleispira sp.]
MAINAEDVQMMRSERVSDNDDGGGQMTGVPIASGDVNNIFDDIPRTTLAYGGVSLRKIFCAIRSANVDKFLGAHAIIADDSDAENVSSLLFSTGDHYDQRIDAQGKVEQFVVLGTRSPLRPVGTQRKGQAAIIMYSELASDAPKIGEVIVFKGEDNGVGFEQYIKVSDVTTRAQKYNYLSPAETIKTYEAVEFVIRITQPLGRDFIGSDPAPIVAHGFDVFKTQSSANAHYFGIKPLQAAATINDREVKVSEIFQAIVPTATTETPILDQKPGLSAYVVQAAAINAITKNLGTHSGSILLTLSSAIVPGTLVLNIAGSIYRDAGKELKLVSGVSRLSSGSVNTVDGKLTLSLDVSSVINATYVPGTSVELLPYTDSITIGSSNRQLTYTDQLAPSPMPGSLKIEYQYLGEWYELIDDGAGALLGNSATGNVNYDTGSVSFSLPAEPDHASRIIYTWARSPYSVNSNVVGKGTTGSVQITLPEDAVAGSIVLTWSKTGTEYTATEQASQTITGDGVGTVLGRAITFVPAYAPDTDVVITYTKKTSPIKTKTHDITAQTGGDISVAIGETGFDPSSVKFVLKTAYELKTTINGVVSDAQFSWDLNLFGRADGALIAANHNPYDASVVAVGSINASTGIVNINGDALTYAARDYVKTASSVKGGGQFVDVSRTQIMTGQTLSIEYRSATTGTGDSYVADLTSLEIAVPLSNHFVVPGSVLFELGGARMSDRGDGKIYALWNEKTAAGIQVGQINYATGELLLNYNSVKDLIANFTGSILAMAAGIGAAAAIDRVVFRTKASPLRPSGLQFLARRASDTALMRAESADNGGIAGSFDVANTVAELAQPKGVGGYSLPIIPVAVSGGSATGTVDYQTGVVDIAFTQPVILSTLTYNAVAFNTVPLDPNILGLNPVRLPTNGKVPIYRAGYEVVIHNTKNITIATPAADQVIDCGRPRLSQVGIIDGDGKILANDQYVVDKILGKVTFSNPFEAKDAVGLALTMPLTLSHRVEDMCAIGRVNIDGTLSLLTQLTHEFPQDETFVSSAILFGTLQARINSLFAQKIDEAGKFLDAIKEGDSYLAIAKYDEINYPILIDNKSAVQERWKVRFTSNSAYQLIGETLGIVGVGSTAADFSPINPMTAAPYFTIKKEGWGSGWVTSNILRFNTNVAAAPIWAIRTVLPSATPIAKDSIKIEFRGDAD